MLLRSSVNASVSRLEMNFLASFSVATPALRAIVLARLGWNFLEFGEPVF